MNIQSFGILLMAVTTIAVILLLASFRIWPRRQTGGFAYTAGPGLLSPAEKSAFSELVVAVGSTGHVCPKVRIADLVKVRGAFLSRSQWQTAFNQISQKHVDFVVIDRAGRTQFAVEVDDKSHDRSDRRRRDAFVNEVFEMAGVALVRVRPGRLRQSDRLQSALAVLRGEPETRSKAAHATT